MIHTALFFLKNALAYDSYFKFFVRQLADLNFLRVGFWKFYFVPLSGWDMFICFFECLVIFCWNLDVLKKQLPLPVFESGFV